MKLIYSVLPVLFLMIACTINEMDKDKDKEWTLIWSDEFENETIDFTKWKKIPRNNADWGNYMSYDERCYDISDGLIHLKGINNPDTITDSRPYLTGGICTRDKFSFQYGKIEIRAKLESATGAWPAMWMLSQNNIYGDYPKNGEIDLMEHLNYDNIIYQTTHSYYTLDLGQDKNPPHHGTTEVNVGEFNIYGMEWYADRLEFTLNGENTFTYPKVENVDPTQWPYDQPFYILIDQQLGGSWVGDVDPEDLPVDMIVDYVRVYE